MLPLSADQWQPLCFLPALRAPSDAHSPPFPSVAAEESFCLCGCRSRQLSLSPPPVGMHHRLCVGDIGETGTLQLLDVWAKVREWQRGAHCGSLRPLRDPVERAEMGAECAAIGYRRGMLWCVRQTMAARY